MSFYTALSYYRPCSPPTVSADDLSRLIGKIRDTGILTGSGVRWLHVKFGESIDQDDKGTHWEEQTVPGIFEVHEIEWDIDLPGSPTVKKMIGRLASDQRRVYRAHISLGMPTDDVRRPITRENSPENEINYYPDLLSIDIGPIKCFDLGADGSYHVGWISVNFSGGGYLYPWTFRNVVERLEGSSEIRRLMDVCRTFWPAPDELPKPRIIELRKRMAELWPYDDRKRRWDWYWGLQESG